MFKNILIYEGRIKRTEYIFSIIIYLIILKSSPILLGVFHNNGYIIFIFYLFLAHLFLAQSAKRCHDRGHSGWYLFIPFYFFWMLFADGDKGANQYGKNLKGIGNEEEEEKETKG